MLLVVAPNLTVVCWCLAWLWTVHLQDARAWSMRANRLAVEPRAEAKSLWRKQQQQEEEEGSQSARRDAVADAAPRKRRRRTRSSSAGDDGAAPTHPSKASF